MELIRGLHNLRPNHRGCAVTIGNFDGVHLGHRAVISQLVERAQTLRVPSVVMLFEPQPQEYFRPDASPARLTRLREKLTALADLPIDRVLCVRFNRRVADLEPTAFVRILLDGLGVRYLIVGADFRFGHARRGDVESLARAGREHGFEVATAPTVTMDRERVSSTRIRAALAAGDMKDAEKLLGRKYRICGRVSRGERIGRRIGIPTANIELRRHRASIAGIFVVEIVIADESYPAVASVGTRPTIGGTRPLLEVHVLDFNRDIYGAHVAVDFLHRLRDERRFDSLEEMRAHIALDIEAARQYFTGRPRVAAGRR
jgi:riboflavin kinase/FMN adenylyltransferase